MASPTAASDVAQRQREIQRQERQAENAPAVRTRT